MIGGDPFAPARRSLVYGPLLIAAGVALIVVGIQGDGLAWLACVLGGFFVLAGLLRAAVATAVLLVERRRKAILRDGEMSTAVIKSAERIGEKSGYPLYKMELAVRTPDGAEHPATKNGAIPPSFDGSLEPGDELPIKIRVEDREFAIDWGGGF